MTTRPLRAGAHSSTVPDPARVYLRAVGRVALLDAGQDPPPGGEAAAGGVAGQALHGAWPGLPRPDPGGQHPPGARGREVRLRPGLQVLDVRDLVDPPGTRPGPRRPVTDDPYPGPRRRADHPAASRPAHPAAGARPRGDAAGTGRGG